MPANKKIAIWLFVCCFMVSMMVLIGGITRLTESGLSMTSWKPVTGWLPPIGEAQWAEEFSRYQASPEFKHINHWMGVEEFKSIFWLEYIHRLAGRITGLVFFLPLVFFAYKKSVDKRLALGLFGILCLGAFQGVVGWLMVSSGLKDAPHVSQYWLAFHLSMAFIIFGILFWLGLTKLGYKSSRVQERKSILRKCSVLVLLVVFVQVIFGAFVAGLDAGLIYNTFPLMDGAVIPEGLFMPAPWYQSAFDEVKTVQFIHRVMAYFVVFTVVVFWFVVQKFAEDSMIKLAANIILSVVCIQFILGVLTLINAVPTPLASAHQMGALILYALVLFCIHRLFANMKK